MLFLQFALGADLYLLDAAQVAEVLPLPELKSLPGAAAGVAGLVNYRQNAVPVIDLCALHGFGPARDRLSTRLVVVHYPTPAGPHRLGLIAEHATGVVRREEAEFASAGVPSTGAPWLGDVTRHERRIAQRIRVEALLTPELRAVLFPADGEARSA